MIYSNKSVIDFGLLLCLNVTKVTILFFSSRKTWMERYTLLTVVLFSFSLSLSNTYPHTFINSRIHIRTSHTNIDPHKIFLSTHMHAPMHTHTHTHSASLALLFVLSLSLSVSLHFLSHSAFCFQSFGLLVKFALWGLERLPTHIMFKLAAFVVVHLNTAAAAAASSLLANFRGVVGLSKQMLLFDSWPEFF